MLPAELFARLAGIANQDVDLGRPEVGRIDRDQDVAALAAMSLFIDPLAVPFDGTADIVEGQLDELAHGMGLARRQYVVVGPVLLQDPPHAVDIVARMAPVTLGVD